MDDAFIIVLIIVLGLLVICSAFFGASETAYSTMNRIRMKSYVKDGNKKAEKALRLSEDYDKLITTLMIGNTFSNITAATVSTILFVNFLLQGSEGKAAAISTIVITLIILTFGEIIPKCIAREKPEKLAMSFSGVLSVLMKVFYPMSIFFIKLKKVLTRSMTEEEVPSMTEEELIVMIDEIEEEGTLEKRESDLIKSAVEFDDIMVGEMCTPRVDVIAVDINADREKIKKAFRVTGFSRIPVYRGTIDQIVGVVYSKDFYNKYLDAADMKVDSIMRPVKFVPATMKISVLLKDLQRSKMHMAVVIDEFGGTVGIVTLEDIIEELIGEIWDESDEVEHEITETSDGSYLVLANANISDVMERAGIKFDPEDYEGNTVGGYVLHKFGHIPVSNDIIELENAVITVKTVKKRRIREVLITKVDRPHEETKDEESSE